uniref:Uncharacterized protein n=1 Tax=Parascaris equorum TaxID=6256 RepID=A0A914RCM8_PAREQ
MRSILRVRVLCRCMKINSVFFSAHSRMEYSSFRWRIKGTYSSHKLFAEQCMSFSISVRSSLIFLFSFQTL